VRYFWYVDSMGFVYLLLNLIAPGFAYDFGIDRLREPEVLSRLEGRRVAMLVHAASVDRDGTHLIDLMYPRFQVKKIFVPEHGLRSLNDGWIKDGVDEKSGLPVLSLYQEKSRAPRPQDLADVDVVVMDLQDVGVRYYTYFSTIAEFVKVAASLGKEIILLDRPNLLGGTAVEGEVLEKNLEGAFISYFTVPTRHGLTLGELIRMYVAEKKIPAKLGVIQVKGWNREPVWLNPDREWTPSSPAILTHEQVFLYALWGSLEHFNLSVGRGKTNERAFRVIAAPWITKAESESLAADLNAIGFSGLMFLPCEFVASRDVYLGQTVRGVSIELSLGLETLRSDEVTHVISSLLVNRFGDRLQFSKFAPNYYGSDWLIETIRQNKPWSDVVVELDSRIKAFKKRREPYVLYE
jgi:uncharacterized protein YbbC (DUF1343 family)